MAKQKSKQTGFTIVELLIVIVVIGILAAIVMASYKIIVQQAIDTSIKKELANASEQLKTYRLNNYAYPTANNCPTPGAGEICLEASSGTTYVYQVNNNADPKTFTLTATNADEDISYRVTSDSSAPKLVVDLDCPSGFIEVPGSTTYGTSDFCVMKYEAKNAGSNVPVSQPASNPWTSISQTNAITYSQNVAGCIGCHLITEAEWLTIAQNLLFVPSNWSGGSVGYGYMYSGHNDNNPIGKIAAGTDDSDGGGVVNAGGYFGTNNSAGEIVETSCLAGNRERRTLTLSNGEVIWDLAGNVQEWTQGTIAGGAQPGLSGETTTYVWKNYNNSSLIQNGLPSSAFPSYALPAASDWTSDNGIGELKSNYGESSAKVFRRGGAFDESCYAGIFTLDMYRTSDYATGTGFRVAR